MNIWATLEGVVLLTFFCSLKERLSFDSAISVREGPFQTSPFPKTRVWFDVKQYAYLVFGSVWRWQFDL